MSDSFFYLAGKIDFEKTLNKFLVLLPFIGNYFELQRCRQAEPKTSIVVHSRQSACNDADTKKNKAHIL